MFSANRIIAATNTAAASILLILALAEATLAADIELDLEGSTAVIPNGGTLTRNLKGIPAGIPGQIHLKLKWHAGAAGTGNNFAFNALNVQVRHGNTVMRSANCYSVHSNKTPKCEIEINVSLTVANNFGEWNLKVVNNSDLNVTGFDVEKGKDPNPVVAKFKSVYKPTCPGTVKLTLEGSTVAVKKGETRLVKLYGIGKAPGIVKLNAKWHVVNKSILAAPIYNYLKIELIAPNGQSLVNIVPDSKIYASIHAVGKSPKLEVQGTIFSQYTNLPGDWKLKVTNNSEHDITAFNLENEGGTINESVPRFSSSYQATCNF